MKWLCFQTFEIANETLFLDAIIIHFIIILHIYIHFPFLHSSVICILYSDHKLKELLIDEIIYN